MTTISLLLTFLLLPARAAETDPYIWLEDVESPKAMEWVKAHNERSLGALTTDPRYAGIEKEVRRITMAKDRLPFPTLANGWIYNFWQDADHVRGLWRRTRPDEYAKKDPKWQTLLDLDKLNKDEAQDWVWQGAVCLPPAHEDCLLRLSHGGKDAVVVKEFDVAKGTFVAGGFYLPDSKTEVGWLDAGRLFVGTDFGPGSMTKSGYPRIVKLWTRGEPLASAKTLFEGKDEDVSVSAYTAFRPEGAVSLVDRGVTFWTSQHWVVEPDLSLKRVPFPEDANLQGVFQGELLALLRSDWKAGDKTLPAGSLVALPLSSLWAGTPEEAAELIYAPDARSSIGGVASSRDSLYLDTLQNVQGKVIKARKSASGWSLEILPLPALGTDSVRAADDFEDTVYLSLESFVVPTTLYSFAAEPGAAPRAVKSLPARFDSKGLEAEQFEATSKDGTKVPYFLVHR